MSAENERPKLSRRTLLLGASGAVGAMALGGGIYARSETTHNENKKDLDALLLPENIDSNGDPMREYLPSSGFIDLSYPFPHYLAEGDPTFHELIVELRNFGIRNAPAELDAFDVSDVSFYVWPAKTDGKSIDERIKNFKTIIDEEQEMYAEDFGHPHKFFAMYPSEISDKVKVGSAADYDLRSIVGIRPNDDRYPGAVDLTETIMAQNSANNLFYVQFRASAEIGKEDQFKQEYGIYKKVVLPTVKFNSYVSLNEPTQ
jgi:hypothetical protein